MIVLDSNNFKVVHGCQSINHLVVPLDHFLCYNQKGVLLNGISIPASATCTVLPVISCTSFLNLAASLLPSDRCINTILLTWVRSLASSRSLQLAMLM